MKIIDIKYLKNGKINVFFDEENKITLNQHSFSEFYLYLNKELTIEEYNEINAFVKKDSEREYLSKILSNRQYSEKQIIDKLFKRKKLSYSEIKSLVKEFKDVHLIDDLAFANDYVEEMKNKNYGRKRIEQSLKEAGIDQSLFEKLDVFDDDEIERATKQYELLKIKNKEKNYIKQKESIYQGLLLKGFDFDIINKVMSQNEIDFDEEKELVKLNRDYNLIKNRKTDKDQIVNTLLRKGYSYQLIKKVLGGNDDGR